MHKYLDRPTSQPTDAHPASQLALRDLRRVAGGLAAGGALFLIMYAIEIGFGLRYGRLYTSDDLPASTLAWGGLTTFTLALLTVAVSLFSLGWSLRRKATLPALAVMVLVSVAFVLMPLNLAFLFGAFGTPQHIPGLMHPILTNLVATILLSLTVLRQRLLPARIGFALLAAGMITFPFILLTIPLEAVMPDYIIADLPFAAWGATLIAVSWMIWHEPRTDS